MPVAEPQEESNSSVYVDNPLYNIDRMVSAMEHANAITRTYGVEIMSINIISASPTDQTLNKSLTAGAVAAAQALQLETTARGRANAVKIEAEAESKQISTTAQGKADA